MQVWGKIAAILESGSRLALVTVLRAEGSVPREPGARMIALPDGRIWGTIGGGALEWQALAAAEALLGRGGAAFATRSFALGPQLGQCCGGRIEVALETLGPDDLPLARDLAAREAAGPLATLARPTADGRLARHRVPDEGLPPGPLALLPDGAILERFADEATPLSLFGAGHVGKALVLALAPLPFRVTWIDPRPGAFPERLPADVRVLERGDPAGALDDAPEGSFVLVMTHSHALDFDIVARALACGRFPHVGLIGSATKRARFRSRLGALGLGEAADARLVCPIGLREIRSKHPAAIAAGVAADLLIRRERLAAAAPRPLRAAHA